MVILDKQKQVDSLLLFAKKFKCNQSNVYLIGADTEIQIKSTAGRYPIIISDSRLTCIPLNFKKLFNHFIKSNIF